MNVTALLVYFAVMSITPGPHNLMCLYLGAKSGIRGSMRFMVGSMGSLFAKCILCGLLNLVLAEKIPVVVPYLKWVGFAYMLYLAYSMVKSAIRPKEDAETSGEGSLRSGILLQVLNIKSWIAALSIYSVYITPYTTAIGVILLAACVFMVFCVAASLIWCGCGRVIQSLYRKYQLPVSCVLAASLVFCAWSAVR